MTEYTTGERTVPDTEPALAITEVRGRYPAEPHALCSHHIEVKVLEIEPRIYLVRLESAVAMDFWLQLTIELKGEQ